MLCPLYVEVMPKVQSDCCTQTDLFFHYILRPICFISLLLFKVRWDYEDTSFC